MNIIRYAREGTKGVLRVVTKSPNVTAVNDVVWSGVPDMKKA